MLYECSSQRGQSEYEDKTAEYERSLSQEKHRLEVRVLEGEARLWFVSESVFIRFVVVVVVVVVVRRSSRR